MMAASCSLMRLLGRQSSSVRISLQLRLTLAQRFSALEHSTAATTQIVHSGRTKSTVGAASHLMAFYRPFSSSSDPGKKSEEPKGEEAPGVAEEPEPETSPEEPEPEEPQLTREEELELEVKNLKDQLLRSLAEQDNTRRIAKRDVDASRSFAIKSFAKSLLDVSDNLSRAMDAVPEELKKDNEGNPVLATLYEGIEMTSMGLSKAFESNGLIQYGKVGDAFDPNEHNALFEFEDESKAPGTIGQVVKAGFKLNDRVLRPAEVGVVKKA